jgi:hypothetical protein
MELEMDKGFQVEPSSNDCKEIRFLVLKKTICTRYLQHNGIPRVKIAIILLINKLP